MVSLFTSEKAFILTIMKFFGYTGTQNLLNIKEFFVPIYIISGIWQSTGWNCIIYLAALSAVDMELYEAARIDGAGRLKQTLYVTLPGIASTIVVLLILRLGQIMNVGFEKTILMYSPSTYETADVISTYMYRAGITDNNYSYSTAVNFFNSVVNFIVIFAANMLSRKYGETSLW
jgi:putative aldouronate transport system permease protein